MSDLDQYELLLTRLARLEKQVADFHHHNAMLEWKRMQERFHGFDAIKNDMCPCCGARVEVIRTDNPPSVMLQAVNEGHRGAR